MMGLWDRWGFVYLYDGMGRGTGGGYSLAVVDVLLVPLYFVLSCPLCLFFISDWSITVVVPVSLFVICFLCFWSL